MFRATRIDRPHRTTAATLTFGDTHTTGRVTPEGHVHHDFVAGLRGTKVIDTALADAWHRDNGLAYEIAVEHVGCYGIIAAITVVEKADGQMHAHGWIQGGDNGGRRYISHSGPDALYDAKRHVKNWANRRFRVPAA